MLFQELISYESYIKSPTRNILYHNMSLGDTSFLLAGLLESLLRGNYIDWNIENWIDDSLITSVFKNKDKIVIEGVVIYGKIDVSEQWTSPFSFEIEFKNDSTDFNKFIFLFGDSNMSEITYNEYNSNKSCWVNKKRKWHYVISSEGNVSN